MAEFKVLIVEDAPETMLILQNVLELKELKWILARNSTEATQLLYEHCPHLLIVDISLGPEDNGLDWLKTVKAGPFAHLHSLVMTSSAFKEDVRQSIMLGVDDYILKPADHQILAKKIHSIRRKLQLAPSYQVARDDGVLGEVEVKGRVQAISETGLCLNSPIPNLVPVTIVNFKSDLFGEMEVPTPQRITLFNYERDPRGRTRDSYPFRNYCQVQGWLEKDLQKVRRWIRSQGLGRSF